MLFSLDLKREFSSRRESLLLHKKGPFLALRCSCIACLGVPRVREDLCNCSVVHLRLCRCRFPFKSLGIPKTLREIHFDFQHSFSRLSCVTQKKYFLTLFLLFPYSCLTLLLLTSCLTCRKCITTLCHLLMIWV